MGIKGLGRREGRIGAIKEIARKLKERNISLEEISICTGLTLDEINKL